MKKIFLILIFYLAFITAYGQQSSQIITGPTTKAIFKGGLQVDSALSIPQDTVMRGNWPKTLPGIAGKNGKLYLWSTTLQKWIESGADSSLYATRTWVSGNFKPVSYVPAWAEITGKPTEFAPSNNSTYYIQNQTAAAQAAGFNINGTGTIINNSTSQFTLGYSPTSKTVTSIGSGGEMESRIYGGSGRYDILLPAAQTNAIPVMTSATTPSGQVSASSVNQGIEANYMAFDGNQGTQWTSLTGKPQWLQYKFATPKTIIKYTLTSMSNNNNRPTDWQFMGSNDGSSWMVLDTQTGQSFPSAGYKNSYNIVNTTPYLYYRINITVGSAANTSIAEMEMFEAFPFAYAFSIDMNRNIGIQNSNPQYPLDIAGAMRLGSLATAPTGANGVEYYNSTTNNFQGYRNGVWNNFLMGGDISGAAGQVAFFNGTNTQTGDPAFIWDNTNKRLGLGVTPTQGTIHIEKNDATASASAGPSIYIKNINPNDPAGVGYNAAWQTWSAGNGIVLGQLLAHYGTGQAAPFNAGSGFYISTRSDHPIIMGTGSATGERLRLANAGITFSAPVIPSRYSSSASLRTVLNVDTTSAILIHNPSNQLGNGYPNGLTWTGIKLDVNLYGSVTGGTTYGVRTNISSNTAGGNHFAYYSENNGTNNAGNTTGTFYGFYHKMISQFNSTGHNNDYGAYVDIDEYPGNNAWPYRSNQFGFYARLRNTPGVTSNQAAPTKVGVYIDNQDTTTNSYGLYVTNSLNATQGKSYIGQKLILGNTLRQANLAATPATGSNGEEYYNSTTNKKQIYTAGAWKDVLMSGDAYSGPYLNITTAAGVPGSGSGIVMGWTGSSGYIQSYSSQTLYLNPTANTVDISNGKLSVGNGTNTSIKINRVGIILPYHFDYYSDSNFPDVNTTGFLNFNATTNRPRITIDGPVKKDFLLNGDAIANQIGAAQTANFWITGNIKTDILKTGSTAPTTTGAIRIVQVDANGQLSFITAASLATYADDAAAGAGGLTSGTPYKTATGQLMIKL